MHKKEIETNQTVLLVLKELSGSMQYYLGENSNAY